MPVHDDLTAREHRTLLDGLRRRGYTVVVSTDQGAEARDGQVTLEHGRTAVRFVGDHGQWFVEIAESSSGAWFSPRVWNAWLQSSTAAAADAGSAAEQVQMLLADLPWIEAANARLDGQRAAELEHWRQRAADARRRRS